MIHRQRRREALVFLGLLLIGGLFGLAFWSVPSRAPFLLSACAYGLLLVLLLALRSRGGSLANAFIITGAAIAMTQIWIVNDVAMRSGLRFEPFLGYKLLPIALAILGPSSLWVGMVTIGATAIAPLVQTWTWPPSVRQALPLPEPWSTLLYSLLAFLLLLYRRRGLRFEREIVRRETSAASAERFMHKFLAVRDLANSPLQSIEATVALLRARHPDSEAQLERIARQVDRLHKLSTVLSQYQPQRWRAADTSFDPLQVLQQLEDSPTEEYDRYFLVRPDSSGQPDLHLSKLEQLLRFTSVGLEHSPVCAFWLGEDGRLVYVNEASCLSLGYSRSELLGMHITSFAPNVKREAWPQRFDAFRRQPHQPPYVSVHRRADGTLIDVEIIASYAELNGRGYVLGFARELEPGARRT